MLRMNKKMFDFYFNLYDEKSDLHTDAILKRKDAMTKGDWDGANFIEEMTLKPLEKQMVFLLQNMKKALLGGEYE